MKRCAGWNPWLLCVVCAGVCGSVSAAADAESSIREVQVIQADAWNKHDAAAYAALFTDDGDCINVVGWRWKGRAQIASKLTAAFATAFRASELTITSTEVRFLTPTIAIAHVRWTMSGYKMPPGMPEPREGVEIQVLEKKAGHWLIQSFQNTIGKPEMAFGGPAPGAPAKP
ncbi:MAG TPA: SgcJ/EcaC family oxidoreductase [Steroidobacteraceae bacterium]|jgi:uncharacterized protein (TIGR02246 family)|nr:SgcJ/EcaC family oxidoreductase [Steroidobacteraceae bacterium]